MPELPPLIFAIHRFATYDGPGIRTVVFLKGCPLACSWCHNPESIRPEAEMAVSPDRCVHCGSCRALCPENAIAGMPFLQINRSRCIVCGKCADSCPAAALMTIGKEYPPDELLEIINRDRHLFAVSGGGVTFSGGEPAMWLNYLGNALTALKAENLHTAIQTCGSFAYGDFAMKILPSLDQIMFDLKFINAAEHKRHTGQDNDLILDNFRRLTKAARSKVLPRVPLVPGITATPANLLEIAAFLADLGYQCCDLLPYNPAGIEKRRAIGMKVLPHLPASLLRPAEEDELRSLFQERLVGASGRRHGVTLQPST